MTERKTVVVTSVLDKEKADKLKNIAAKHGRSRSSHVTILLDQYIKQEEINEENEAQRE